MKVDDAAALAALGFRIAPSDIGRNVIVPLDSSDVQIDPSLVGKSCPVNLPSGAPSIERLTHVLKEKGLKVETLPSPIGGTLINAKDRSGNLVTTTQVMPSYIVTLVVGAVRE